MGGWRGAVRVLAAAVRRRDTVCATSRQLVGVPHTVAALHGSFSHWDHLRGSSAAAVGGGRWGGRGGGRGQRGGGGGRGGRGPPDERVTALAQELLRSPDAAAVRGVLDRHDSLSSKQMTGLIGMLGRAHGFKGKQRLDWVVAWAAERKALDVFNYRSYIAQLNRQEGRLNDVEAAFERMQAAGVKPDVHTYSSLISAYDTDGQWQKAEEAFVKMQAAGLTPDDYTYNSLISAYDKGEQWQKAEEAFVKMQAAVLTPDDFTYNSLISAYDTGEQWQKAEEAFVKMQAAGLTPDDFTYNSLITTYDKGEQWQKAEEAFMKMQAAGLTPNVHTYNSLISAYDKGGQWQRAMLIFKEITQAEMTLDIHTYNPLLSVLWVCGHRAKAIELFEKASEAGVYPQGDHKLGMIDLHELSNGAALASLTLWLDAMAASTRLDAAGLPTTLEVVTGWGKGSRVTGESEVKDAVTAFLAELGSPFEAPSDNSGWLKAKRTAVGEWLESVGPVKRRVCGDHPPSYWSRMTLLVLPYL